MNGEMGDASYSYSCGSLMNMVVLLGYFLWVKPNWLQQTKGVKKSMSFTSE